VLLNRQYCEAYRTYALDLPAFLRNRPRDFVVHMMHKLDNAADITSDNITTIDNRTLQVRSADSLRSYEVFFGNDQSMPHCQCFDWKKTHWPCKHFCAVFIHCEKYGWDELCSNYRCSPYFVIDSDVVTSMNTTHTSSGENERDSICPGENECKSAGTNSLELSDSLGTESLSRECRETLKSLSDLTYTCADMQTLDELNKRVKELHLCFLRSLPNEDGLIVPPKPVSSRKRKVAKKHCKDAITNNVSEKIKPSRKQARSSEPGVTLAVSPSSQASVNQLM